MGGVAELHIHRFGPSTGPVVLALHGLTGHGGRWQRLADDHLPDLRILAPDLRGHGRSPGVPPWDFETLVDDLAALLRAETREPVVALGHSFGGAVAVHLAHRHPELVRALVLLDPATGLEPARMLDIANSMLAYPDYASREQARSDKLDTAWGEVDPAVLEAELDEHLVPTANGRVGWRMTMPAIIAFWGEIARDFVLPPRDMPTVLVQAMKVNPPLVAPAFRAALTAHLGERLTPHDFDCDHMVAQARPAETAALVRTVL
ncbi:alpha/beta fold hydrolase [Nocardia seriolae]|uniref:alpha/beta fold hydrolase n=1 Tax=Nocardia seriolae TaxID=37332 RepID=UPI0008F5334F|nr:alpha/beta hydrolase [Nocardia seriolae]MTJ65684.1 alpha/beta fold hydrolase [Nocardia seriolae]MTJ74300.1 alpha/beta fold hydrolase [Nocardia seriolae]MTJ86388.1 alpha/beta fold hydrolase [Nocardia seriolae]MTK30381.1 alpha/beta fold hydrolase [Nocardia seriolae]MTK43679.1 alpha/beta fold hydrolase [Nocardia seriolae]